MLKFGAEDQTPNLRLQGQGIDRHPLVGLVDASFESQEHVYVKTGSVIAYEAPRAGTVVTLEGEMAFHGGDMIVTDNPPTHAWPVRRDVFESTYARLNGVEASFELEATDVVVDIATGREITDEVRVVRTTREWRLDSDGNRIGEPKVEDFVMGHRPITDVELAEVSIQHPDAVTEALGAQVTKVE